VFRAGGASWGHIAMIRGENQPDFTDQEVAFVTRIGAHLGHGLREALLREAAASQPDRAPGMIILGKDGSVLSATDQARFWLGQFPRDRETGLQLPVAVDAVARRAVAQAQSGPAYASVRLISGKWLTVHAAPMHTGSPNPTTVAVMLAPVTPAELEPLRLALHGLTPREREVAQLLARGASSEEIARALWISRYTVKDHVKAVHAKLRVGGRAELTARLFHEHIAPQLDNQRVREFGPAEPAR
jgi:DNA-binding CsgD family transcriptional regulator